LLEFSCRHCVDEMRYRPPAIAKSY
jgi:hypothetical protein